MSQPVQDRNLEMYLADMQLELEFWRKEREGFLDRTNLPYVTPGLVKIVDKELRAHVRFFESEVMRCELEFTKES